MFNPLNNVGLPDETMPAPKLHIYEVLKYKLFSYLLVLSKTVHYPIEYKICSKTSSFYICSIFSIPWKWYLCASGYPTGFVHRALLLCTASSHIIYRYKQGAYAEHVYHIRASLLAHEMEIKYELRLERTDLQGNRLEMIRSIRQKAEWQREVTHYQRLKKGKSAFALSGFKKIHKIHKTCMCTHLLSRKLSKVHWLFLKNGWHLISSTPVRPRRTFLHTPTGPRL